MPYDDELADAVCGWIARPCEVGFIGGRGDRLAPEEVSRWVAAAEAAFLLIEDDEPVAFGVLGRSEAALPEHHLEVGHVLVSPARRRRGIGRLFVAWLCAQARRLEHAVPIARVVPVNVAALGLVIKLEFQEITESCSWDRVGCRWFWRGIAP